jgi:hypothetical protein
VDKDPKACALARLAAPTLPVLAGDVAAHVKELRTVTHAFLDFCSPLSVQMINTTAAVMRSLSLAKGEALIGVGFMRGREQESLGQGVIPLGRGMRRQVAKYADGALSSVMRGDRFDVYQAILKFEKLMDVGPVPGISSAEQHSVRGVLARAKVLEHILRFACLKDQRAPRWVSTVVYHSRDRQRHGVPMIYALYSIQARAGDGDPVFYIPRQVYVPSDTVRQVDLIDRIRSLSARFSLGISRKQWAAIKAHVTRGTYDP